MKNLLRLITGFLLILALAPAAFAQSENGLAGTRWELESYAGTPAAEGASATLEFIDAAQVIGSGGCNSYGGSYAVEGDALTFSGIASTLMMCADEAVGAQETAFFEALNTATRYELTDEGLTIWYGDNQELRFVKGKELIGLQWQLESIGETPVADGSVVTMTLGSDRGVMGSGGCNSYSGSHMVNGSALTFGEVISTKMACADEAAGAQETAFFEALQTATRYELTDDGLTVWYGDEQELHFVVSLTGTQWLLEAIDGTPVVAESAVTLEFGEGNAVSGTGGCNGYSGTYTLDGDSLTFSPLVSTMMACADDTITQQEAAFLQALQTATRFELARGRLTIWYGDEQTLTFISIAQTDASG